jgi:hypothetical protein
VFVLHKFLFIRVLWQGGNLLAGCGSSLTQTSFKNLDKRSSLFLQGYITFTDLIYKCWWQRNKVLWDWHFFSISSPSLDENRSKVRFDDSVLVTSGSTGSLPRPGTSSSLVLGFLGIKKIFLPPRITRPYSGKDQSYAWLSGLQLRLLTKGINNWIFSRWIVNK